MIFLEHKVLYDTHGDVPEEPYAIPFGDAKITREGDDVTIVAFGRMVCLANDVADKLSGEISVEVVDPRTTSPHLTFRDHSGEREPYRPVGGG